MISFEIKETFLVTPAVLYKAWLNSTEHTNMTGGEAQCSKEVGDEFSAWDGYISGKNLSLKTNIEIVQAWRTTEFGEEDKDSILTLTFEEVEQGCLLTLFHEEIPDGQPDYQQGWIDHYFEPMKDYFISR